MASSAWGPPEDDDPKKKDVTWIHVALPKRRGRTVVPAAHELEHQYLRLKDENDALRTHAASQSEKNKKLKTQIAKLTNDLKHYRDLEARGLPLGGGDSSSMNAGGRRRGGGSGGGGRNKENEALIDDLQAQLRRCKAENSELKAKLSSARKQATKASRRGAYDYVTARTDTGMGFSRSSKSRGGTRQRPDHIPPPSRGGVDTENLAVQNEKLRNVVAMLRENLALAAADISKLEAENEELARYGDESGSRNMEMTLMKYQQEIKSKENEMVILKGQFDSLQLMLEPLREKESNYKIQIAELRASLSESQSQVVRLQNDAKRLSELEAELSDAQVLISELEASSNVIGTYKSRMEGMFGAKDRERQALVDGLRSEIETLNAKLSAQAAEKESLLARLQDVMRDNDELRKAASDNNMRAFELQEKNENLAEQLQGFIGAGLNLVDLQEALAIIRRRREREQSGATPNFVTTLDELPSEAESSAHLLRELEKANHLLSMREQLLQEALANYSSLENDIRVMRTEYEEKLSTYALRLDKKNARIRRLEDLLHAVPGHKDLRRQPDEADALDVKLGEDENLFEVNIERLELSDPAYTRETTSFVAFDFFEHETVVTSLGRGLTPSLLFTAQYVVTMDEFFFNYLESSALVLEFHVAQGLDARHEGTAVVSFEEVMRDRSGNGLPAVLDIVHAEDAATVLGRVHLSLRMLRPMTEAITLYIQRSEMAAALNPAVKMATLHKRHEARLEALAPKNTLVVRVKGARDLVADVDSASVYFQLLDEEVAHTAGAPVSNGTVVWDDEEHAFTFAMTRERCAALKTGSVEFVVFDRDPSVAAESCLLGSATLRLLPLTSGEQLVRRAVELTQDSDGEAGGLLTVEIELLHPYAEPTVEATADSAAYKARRTEPPLPIDYRDYADGAEVRAVDAEQHAADLASLEPHERVVVAVGAVHIYPEFKSSVVAHRKGDLTVAYNFLGRSVMCDPTRIGVGGADGKGSRLDFDSTTTFAVQVGSESRAVLADNVLADPELDLDTVDFVLQEYGGSNADGTRSWIGDHGTAIVSLRDIYNEYEDNPSNETLELHGLGKFEGKIIGTLTYSMEVIDVIASIAEEGDDYDYE